MQVTKGCTHICNTVHPSKGNFSLKGARYTHTAHMCTTCTCTIDNVTMYDVQCTMLLCTMLLCTVQYNVDRVYEWEGAHSDKMVHLSC